MLLRLGRLWGEQLHKVVRNQSCLVTLTNLEEGGGRERDGGKGTGMEREREGQMENHW